VNEAKGKLQLRSELNEALARIVVLNGQIDATAKSHAEIPEPNPCKHEGNMPEERGFNYRESRGFKYCPDCGDSLNESKEGE
jgi:hypothetical protein